MIWYKLIYYKIFIEEILLHKGWKNVLSWSEWNRGRIKDGQRVSRGGVRDVTREGVGVRGGVEDGVTDGVKNGVGGRGASPVGVGVRSEAWVAEFGTDKNSWHRYVEIFRLGNTSFLYQWVHKCIRHCTTTREIVHKIKHYITRRYFKIKQTFKKSNNVCI